MALRTIYFFIKNFYNRVSAHRCYMLVWEFFSFTSACQFRFWVFSSHACMFHSWSLHHQCYHLYWPWGLEIILSIHGTHVYMYHLWSLMMNSVWVLGFLCVIHVYFVLIPIGLVIRNIPQSFFPRTLLHRYRSTY
jgi:hypothetical protein